MREKCKCYEVSLQQHLLLLHHHLLLLSSTAAIIELQKVNRLSAEIILACLHLLYFFGLGQFLKHLTEDESFYNSEALLCCMYYL